MPQQQPKRNNNSDDDHKNNNINPEDDKMYVFLIIFCSTSIALSFSHTLSLLFADIILTYLWINAGGQKH